MKKILKWVIGILLVLVVGGACLMYFGKKSTKKHSPEARVEYSANEINYSVFYCRPSKKGREIFGGLVPFGEVWRTGANEATTITVSEDVLIGGQSLKAGTYSLWTIPGEETWKVIFNSKEYGWGVTWGAKASREPEFDELEIEVPVRNLENEVEQFTIYFEDVEPVLLNLMWDQTHISVPIF